MRPGYLSSSLLVLLGLVPIDASPLQQSQIQPQIFNTHPHNHSLQPSRPTTGYLNKRNPISPSFPYGSSSKVRGVNIGGWLVLESWITPSIFDNTNDDRIIDEWTFGQYYKSKGGVHALKHHWDTWITEKDFAQIKHAGLNHVRLPIGFWAWEVSGGEPYIQGQLPYLDKAVRWASKHGLKLIIDLHGAPGSQNGFDHSGRRSPSPKWHYSRINIDRTNAIIKKIANRYKDRGNVVSVVSPLNEPAVYRDSSMLDPLKQFYKDSYGNVRYPFGSSKQSNMLLLLHDAYQNSSYWDGVFSPPHYQGVAFDTHIYQIFSEKGEAMSKSQHIRSACSQSSRLSKYPNWVIVGEWTPAMTDCAKYLNGRGVGSRYDGTKRGSHKIGSCVGKTGHGKTFSTSFKKFLRQMWEAQVIAYERGGIGWLMWNWKNEQADEWSYKAGLKYGWIPSNPTDLKYPNICD